MLEREAALRSIELVRTHAEVEQRAIEGSDAEFRKNAADFGKIRTVQDQARAVARELFASLGDCRRILISRNDFRARFEQSARVPAAAECALEENFSGRRQQVRDALPSNTGR